MTHTPPRAPRPSSVTRPGSRPGSPGRSAARPDPQTDGERLSKRIMALAGCSRSEAENYIDGGWVQIDGQLASNPATRVRPAQTVALDPAARLEKSEDVTIILHKLPGQPDAVDPIKGTESSAAVTQLLRPENHWASDRSGVRPAPRHFRQLRSMVMLEQAASGLLVFTQDWRRVRKLEEEAGSLEHELIFDVAGALPEGALEHMQKLLRISAEPLPASHLSVSSQKPNSSQLRLAVKGSHPGLAAYLCGQTGLQITGLRRIRLGRIGLGALPPGKWCYLAGHQRF